MNARMETVRADLDTGQQTRKRRSAEPIELATDAA
jgi:hypothetical protein